MTVRTALAVTIVIGILWALLGLIFHQTVADFVAGALVVASSWTVLGLLDWLRR